MNNIVKILPNYKKFNSNIQDVKSGITPIMLSGLTDSGKVHFSYASHFYSEKPICIITYNELQAKKIQYEQTEIQKKIQTLQNEAKNENAWARPQTEIQAEIDGLTQNLKELQKNYERNTEAASRAKNHPASLQLSGGKSF